MYMDQEPMNPRDRINDETLRRMLGNDQPCPNEPMTDLPQKTNLHLPDGFPLASVYAPTQVFRNLYDCETALSHGTIFEELDLPFLGLSVSKGGSCRG